VSAVDVLAQAVRDARTEYAHARQWCMSGQKSQAQYEAARVKLDEAKAALASITGVSA
jgi:hypothetical protein